jgi:hypothetical protein
MMKPKIYDRGKKKKFHWRHWRTPPFNGLNFCVGGNSLAPVVPGRDDGVRHADRVASGVRHGGVVRGRAVGVERAVDLERGGAAVLAEVGGAVLEGRGKGPADTGSNLDNANNDNIGEASGGGWLSPDFG